MNIYKTKDGKYINMAWVSFIRSYTVEDILKVGIDFDEGESVTLAGDQAKAFLEYLDNHLLGVYAGSA